MTKTITGVLFNGQPLFEEWSEDKRTLRWFSREVEGDYPKSWKVKRYVPLGEFKADHRTRPDTLLERIRQARINLLDLPGMKADERVLAGIRARAGHPERGQQKQDEHGAIRCMAYADGYVMVRRKGCVPWVMPEDKWHALSP